MKYITCYILSCMPKPRRVFGKKVARSQMRYATVKELTISQEEADMACSCVALDSLRASIPLS